MLLCSFSLFFFFNDTATTEIYTLSLHDALPICGRGGGGGDVGRHDHDDGVLLRGGETDRPVGERGGQLRSEEHTSELQSLAYLVCRLLLEKKKQNYYSIMIIICA